MIHMREIRLNKAIAMAGVASRREADRLILRGEVSLNGQPVTEPGVSMVPGRDRLVVSGRTVKLASKIKTEVWALYKPKRCVSTLKDPQGRSSLADFLPLSRHRLFPVGRLDYDAEGLILLTNDGELAHKMAHPSFEVEKIYLVKVKGVPPASKLSGLQQGPVLEGRRRAPVKARLLHTLNDKSWLEVRLHEGIQHHIKKLFSGIGHRVLKIKRYQVGTVELGDLNSGEARKLDEHEIKWMLEHPHGDIPEKNPGRTRRRR